MTSLELKLDEDENKSDDVRSEDSSNDDDGEDGDEEIDIWSYPRKSNVLKKLEEKKDVEQPEMESAQRQMAQSASTVFTERFKELQKRRMAMKERTDHLQAKTMARKAKKTARRALRDPEVKLEMEKLRRKDNTDDKESKGDGETDKAGEREWNKVKTFINVNKHLAGPIDHGWCGPKSDLERKIEKAIENGDFDVAEKLSDQLSNRDFAVKVHEAIEAKKFSERQEAQNEHRAAKKMKTLHWGFEAKERWEMKSNL